LKHLQLFEQFINESYNFNTTQKDIIDLFNKHGFTEVNTYKGNIGTSLDTADREAVNKLTKEANSLVLDVTKYAKKHNVLMLQTAIGYTGGNSLSVTLASEKANVRKLYHMTSKKNVANILKDGLSATQASGHSDTFGSGLSGKNIKEQLYRAVFAVSGKGQAKKLPNYFKFDEPVLLEINPKTYTWYHDPLMPSEMKSVLSYDNIKAEDIKEIL
jgi:hypothetical protein